jgi:hypothetical protein
LCCLPHRHEQGPIRKPASGPAKCDRRAVRPPLSAQLGWKFDQWERDAQSAVTGEGAQKYEVKGDDLTRWRAPTQSQIANWIAARDTAGDNGRMLLKAVHRIADQYH